MFVRLFAKFSDNVCYVIVKLFRLYYCKHPYLSEVTSGLKVYADAAIVNPFTLHILVIPKGSVLAGSHLVHELCHVEQVKRLGSVKFFVLYLLYSIRYGYVNNPFEVEARSAEG
jgi:hypothetical protein